MCDVMTDEQSILDLFDRAAAEHQFPDLDHVYEYLIDCRLHAFADATRWALVVEKVAYTPRGGAVRDVVHVFDNAGPGAAPRWRSEIGTFDRVENWDEIEDEWEPEVFAGSAPVRVRGRDLDVTQPAGAGLVDVFRGLVPQHRDLLLCDEEELGWLVPGELPRLLVIDAWYQPDLFRTIPSQCETYVQLARVLATGAVDAYRPTHAPNTHWSRWPGSGSL
ncbi:hypothetical protein GCM10010413_27350 [Promicromonospora sukumoe]